MGDINVLVKSGPLVYPARPHCKRVIQEKVGVFLFKDIIENLIMKNEDITSLGAGIGIGAGLFFIFAMNDWMIGSVILLLGIANLGVMFWRYKKKYKSRT